MAVTVPIVYKADTSEAQRAASEYVEGVKADLSALESEARGAVGALEKVGKEAGDAGDAAERTAESVERLARFEAIERATGAIGDFKDSLLQAGPALLGFSEQTTELIGKTGDLAEKGAALGGTFGGPLGAAAGALIGGAFGLLAGVFEQQAAAAEKDKEAARALEERLSTLRAENESLAKSLRKASAEDVPGLVSRLAELEEQAEETREALRKAREGASEYSTRLYLLELETAEETSKAFRVLQKDIIGTLKVALDTEEPPAARTMAQIKEASEDARAELKKAKAALSEIYKAIEEAPGTVGGSLDALGLGSVADAAARVEELRGAIERASEAIKANEAELSARRGAAKKDAQKASADTKEATKELEEFYISAGAHERALAATVEVRQVAQYVAEADAARTHEAFLRRSKAEEAAFFASLERQKEARKEAEESARRELEVTASMYSALLSPIEDVVSSVFSTVGDNIEAGARAFAHFGASTKKAIGEALKAIGQRFRVEAFGEFAAALASLATPGLRKDAPGHFAASAAYGAAAAAAGVTGALLGRGANRADDATDRFRQDKPEAVRQTGAPQPAAPVIVNFQSIVPATQQQQQDAAREISKILDAGRAGGVI